MPRPHKKPVHLSDAITLYRTFRAPAVSKQTLAQQDAAMKRFREIVCEGLPAGTDGLPDRLLAGIDREALMRWNRDVIFYKHRSGQMKRITQNTHQARLSQVKLFFDWAEDMRLLAADMPLPTIGLKPIKNPKHDYLYLDPIELSELMDRAPDAHARWFFAASCYLGARFESELSDLRIRDARSFLETGQIPILRIKTSSRDHLPLADELRQEIVRWLAFYESNMRMQLGNEELVLHPEWHLFPALMKGWRPKGQMVFQPDRHPAHAERIIKRVLEAGGYRTDKEGMHTGRRSVARSLYIELTRCARLPEGHPDRYEGDASPFDAVRQWLGHTGPAKITWDYIGMGPADGALAEFFKGRKMFKQTGRPAEDVQAEQDARVRATSIRHLRSIKDVG